MMMPEHVCHARNCLVPVQHKMFMCRKHWFMVPKVDRDLVWALYQPGQEQGKVRPSDEYLEETLRIINELAEKESDWLKLKDQE